MATSSLDVDDESGSTPRPRGGPPSASYFPAQQPSRATTSMPNAASARSSSISRSVAVLDGQSLVDERHALLKSPRLMEERADGEAAALGKTGGPGVNASRSRPDEPSHLSPATFTSPSAALHTRNDILGPSPDTLVLASKLFARADALTPTKANSSLAQPSASSLDPLLVLLDRNTAHRRQSASIASSFASSADHHPLDRLTPCSSLSLSRSSSISSSDSRSDVCSSDISGNDQERDADDRPLPTCLSGSTTLPGREDPPMSPTSSEHSRCSSSSSASSSVAVRRLPPRRLAQVEGLASNDTSQPVRDRRSARHHHGHHSRSASASTALSSAAGGGRGTPVDQREDDDESVVSVKEATECYVVSLLLPSFSLTDLTISHKNDAGRLSVYANRWDFDHQEEKQMNHAIEFRRLDADLRKARAQFDGSTLSITVPRSSSFATTARQAPAAASSAARRASSASACASFPSSSSSSSSSYSSSDPAYWASSAAAPSVHRPRLAGMSLDEGTLRRGGRLETSSHFSSS